MKRDFNETLQPRKKIKLEDPKKDPESSTYKSISQLLADAQEMRESTVEAAPEPSTYVEVDAYSDLYSYVDLDSFGQIKARKIEINSTNPHKVYRQPPFPSSTEEDNRDPHIICGCWK